MKDVSDSVQIKEDINAEDQRRDLKKYVEFVGRTLRTKQMRYYMEKCVNRTLRSKISKCNRTAVRRDCVGQVEKEACECNSRSSFVKF